jgi:chitin synthase
LHSLALTPFSPLGLIQSYQTYHEDEAENTLLHHGPFDDQNQMGAHPTAEHQSSYSLNETYRPDATTLNLYGDNYSSQNLQDPGAAFGVPGRVPSPYARSDTSSTEAWKQRQQPGGAGGLKRYATRKVKLVQGSVLSVDYPVPSAIQNSVQKKYRDDLEGGSEEFTHMRCK